MNEIIGGCLRVNFSFYYTGFITSVGRKLKDVLFIMRTDKNTLAAQRDVCIIYHTYNKGNVRM